MILPSVMPDELARSLISRICILNGADGPDALMPDMASLFSSPSNAAHSPSWCDLLASANRVTPQAFHAGHTLLPFRRAVRPVAECIAFGLVRDLFESSAHGPNAHAKVSRTLHLCLECTNEDVQFWGFSYWRRSHQLPGSVLCQKHQVELHKAQTFNWRDLPHDLLTASTPIDAAIIKSAKQNPVIQRYIEISAALVERTQPVSTAWMVHVLKRKLQAYKDPTGRTTRRLTVKSRLVINALLE
jgi:hypothetical protein